MGLLHVPDERVGIQGDFELRQGPAVGVFYSSYYNNDAGAGEMGKGGWQPTAGDRQMRAPG